MVNIIFSKEVNVFEVYTFLTEYSKEYGGIVLTEIKQGKVVSDYIKHIDKYSIASRCALFRFILRTHAPKYINDKKPLYEIMNNT